MFNENETFSYSIEVAADIYKSLKTQEEANENFYKQVELFFFFFFQEFETFEGNGVAGFGHEIFESEEQTIQVLIQYNNEPSVYAVILSTHEPHTMRLFEEGLSKKYLFGLPIFRMQWFEEMDRAFIYFITRDSYLKFDTPRGRMEKELFGF